MKRAFTYCLIILLTLPALQGKGRSQYLWPDSQARPSVVVPDLDRNTGLDTVHVQPSMLFMPLIFDHQQDVSQWAGDVATPRMQASQDEKQQDLNVDHAWLDKALSARKRAVALRYRAMTSHPQLVPYNERTLPEPPKEYIVTPDPSRNKLVIKPTVVEPSTVDEAFIERRELKRRNWLHTVYTSLHFTQAYISDNWYQGGENNVNVLGSLQWDINLNQTLHPKYLFENTVSYKLGIMTAHNDSLRNYAINEDNFQLNSKFGYKAVKNFYYSATLQFKTQFLNNYKSNTRSMKASFLSPGELNVGLGMTYNYKDKESITMLSLSVAPLSYNMKMCRNIDDLDPTTFGIDVGHHTKHSFGSNLEGKLTWKIKANITWTSRLYAFTNYEYVQGDWENTFDFSITRHLNTQIYTHLRYDKSHTFDPDWKYWQFKEILSFGLTYRFATN